MSTENKNVFSVEMVTPTLIDFNELVDEVSWIMLENNLNGYLRDCWKIIQHKDYYYLYSLTDFAVCIFDKNGKFIKRIDGSIGKGSIETPCDIFIDEKNDQLWILESRHFIYKYTLSGEFINQEKLPFEAVKISSINDNFLFYNGGFDKKYPYYIRLTTSDYTTLQGFVKKPKNINEMNIPVSLFTYDKNKNAVFALLPHNDTIYLGESSKGGYVSPFLHLNFGGDLLTFSDYPSQGFSDKEMAKIIVNKEKIHSITGFNFASGLLFMKSSGKDNSYRTIDIANRVGYKFNSILDNISALSVVTAIQGSTGTSLLISLPAKSLLDEYALHDNQTRYQSIKELLNTIEPTDNRVLIELVIKDIKTRERLNH